MNLDDFAAHWVPPAVDHIDSGSPQTMMPGVAQLLREREEAHAEAHAAAQATRQMETFLSVASHELKNPVTSSSLSVRMATRRLNGLLDQVAAQDADLSGRLAAVLGLLTQAQDRLDRLSRMVTDLLDLSQTRVGNLAVHPQHSDLRAIVRMAVDEQRQMASTRRIHVHTPDALSVSVWADVDRIHQVVTNYLTNALKYAPPDWPIVVRVERQANWVFVSVCDQGPGIAVDEQDRVWEPFHRNTPDTVCGKSPHGAVQSLGLGLYICKQIIEQHQGQVGVQSALGQGSTFWFALPIVCSAHDAQPCLERTSA